MFEKLEQLAKDNKKISDFHIRSGSPLAYRQTGEIVKVPDVMVTNQDLKDLLSMNCNEHELNKFEKTVSILIKFGSSIPLIFLDGFINKGFISLNRLSKELS